MKPIIREATIRPVNMKPQLPNAELATTSSGIPNVSAIENIGYFN